MPRDPLSRDVVVSTALEITSAKGLSALTMRELAAQLDVTPMAVYRYVPNRDALVKLVADGIGALIHPEMNPTRPWDVDARSWALEQRRVLRHHAGVAAWLVQNGPAGQEAYRLLDLLAGCLIRGGFGTSDVARGCAAIMSWTFTRVLVEDAAEERAADGHQERSTAFLSKLTTISPHEHPGATDVGQEFFTLSMEEIFHSGLNAILDGLDRRRSAAH